MGRIGKFLRRFVRLTQDLIQFDQCVDAAALGCVRHLDGVGNPGPIHHIVFQISALIHGIQDCIRYRLRGLRSLVLCWFNG